MLKRILLLSDETPSSRAAQDFAVGLAVRHGAAITGLSGIDETQAHRAEPVPPGGSAWSEHRAQKEIEGAKERCRRLEGALKEACKARGVALQWRLFDGDPLETVARLAEEHDIIVTGHDTSFHGQPEPGVAAMPMQLLQATPRPVIVTPDALVEGGTGIIAAYDGSGPSVRALQMALFLGILTKLPARLLGLLGRQPMRVVGIGDRAGAAAGRAVAYLGAHGLPASAVILAEEGTHAQQIVKLATEQRPHLLVMGAYGHRGWREVLFGTTTQKILEGAPCPLFLYH